MPFFLSFSLRLALRRLLTTVLLSVAALPAGAAVVLQYHHVSDETPAATSISPALFRQHMAHLREAGYAVVSLPDLAARLRSGEPLPDRTVAITFDDGYDSIYQTAFPILKKYGWPFTVFVNTRPIDQGLEQFVSWKQLREMAAAGATVANHSYSHPHLLRRRQGESESAWRARVGDEILRAEMAIAKETGQEHRLFAYPYGEYDRETGKLLEDLGFMAFGQQSGPLAATDDLQALPRFPFGGPYGGMEDFKVKAASLPLPLSAAQVSAADDTVLPQSLTRPALELRLKDEDLAKRVRCFASGQGAIPVQVRGGRVTARAPKDLPVGRSRYNCTAPSAEPGRFYWYSRLFIRKQADGEWYPES